MKQKLLNITFCFFLILCVNACTRDATSKIEQGASATQFHTNIITAEPEPAEPEIIDTPTPEPPQEPNGERTETVIETGFISRGETYSVTAYHDSEADKTMYRVYIIGQYRTKYEYDKW